MKKAHNTPLHSGFMEMDGTNATSRWGGRGSLEFAFGYPASLADASLMPVLSISGFYNITDTISLILEVEDLLYPFPEERWLTTRLSSGELFSWYPYEAPGTRATVKVQINL
jgi:hypothetical protein